MSVGSVGSNTNPQMDSTKPPLTGFSGAVTTDSLTTWDNSFLGYLYLVGTTNVNLAQTLKQQELSDTLFAKLVFQQLNEMNSSTSAALENVFNDASAQIANWNALNTTIASQQQAVASYNSAGLASDQSAVQDLQNAVSNYNAINNPTSADTTNLNNAINTYNAYRANTSSHPYNTAASAFNTALQSSANQQLIAQIPQLNAYYAANNIPSHANPYVLVAPATALLATLSGPVPTAPPAPNITGITIPTVKTAPSSLVTTPTLADYLNAFTPKATAQSILLAVQMAYTVFASSVQAQNSTFNPLIDTLADRTLPRSYINSIPPVFFDNGRHSSLTGGLGIPLASKAAQNQSGPSVLGLGIYGAILQQAKNASFDPSTVANQLVNATQQSLAQIAVNSGQTAAQILSNLGVTDLNSDPALVNVAIATAFLQTVRAGATTPGQNAISSQITGQLQSLGLPESLTTALAAGSQVVALVVGLEQLGLALGLPGLAPQVLGNVQTPPSSSSDGSVQVAANPVLENPLSLALLKNSLYNIILQSGFSGSLPALQNAINQVVNTAVNAQRGSVVFDLNAFKANLLQSLGALTVGSLSAQPGNVQATVNGSGQSLFLPDQASAFADVAVQTDANGQSLFLPNQTSVSTAGAVQLTNPSINPSSVNLLIVALNNVTQDVSTPGVSFALSGNPIALRNAIQDAVYNALNNLALSDLKAFKEGLLQALKEETDANGQALFSAEQANALADAAVQTDANGQAVFLPDQATASTDSAAQTADTEQTSATQTEDNTPAFSVDQTSALADAAAQYVQTEQSVPGLNTPYEQLTLPELITRLNLPTQTEIGQNADIQNAISQTLAQPFPSNRAFHAALVTALESTGQLTTTPNATQLANQITQQVVPQPILAVNEPLKGIGPAPILPLDQLYQQLNADVKSVLGNAVAYQKSPEEARRIVSLVIGGQSVLNALNQQTQRLTQMGNDASTDLTDALKATGQTLATPAVPLYVLKSRVQEIVKNEVEGYMNPVRSTDLRTQDTAKQPSNWKRDIDVRV